tara:strand:+ start:7126 stop:9024 length:1899 start_codon:yes stop_codon:yes gene_type:complete
MHLKRRVIFVFTLLCIAFCAVLVKAFKVQVIDRDALLTKSRNQIFREVTVYPKRGHILDRNGHPLAINVQTYSLFTIPKQLEGDHSAYRELAKIVPHLPYAKIKSKVKNRDRYTWLARKIRLDDHQVEAVKKLKGIYIEAVPKRIYPNGDLAAQTLGFVGVDNSGLAGLEYEFNQKLKGEPTILKYIRDAKGRPIKFESNNAQKESHDITLTIDKDLQAIAEKALKDAVDHHQARGGGVGVIDADTGEILAMANYPTYDPNKLRSSDNEFRKLSFVNSPIEPGSIFKIFTVASALENHIAKPETNYYCEQGKMVIDGHLVTESDSKKKYEWLSVADIIKDSSNIGTTKIAFDLTYPRLKKTIKDFGFGEKTGVRVPGESRGIFNDQENVSTIRLSNISFGQGIATTGVQVLAAYAAIANGGEYIEPRIIKDNSVKIKKRRVISLDTANDLTKMLVSAVEDGTGGNARIPYFKIAGKTSTAQRPDSRGGYSGYIPGFVGFPLNIDNRFVVYVYVDDPKENGYYGNQAAAPVFKKVTQYILYKNKDFDRIAEDDDAAKKLEAFDSVKTVSSAARTIAGGIPDFVGLDRRSATSLAEKVGVNIIHKGIGVVLEQSPGPGAAKDGPVKLIYAPPRL